MIERKIPLGAVIAFCIVSISCWYLFTTIHLTRSQPYHEGQTNLISGVLENFVSGISKSWNVTTGNGLKEFGRNEDLILYAYSESETALDNIAFFRRHALHSRADFIFIFNGEHTVETSELQHLPNVRVIERDNTCMDLGAYWEVLSADDSHLAKAYKRYVFMNASLRGPFLPSSSRNVCWSDAYMDRLDDVTKLVGMTWNCAKADYEGFPPHLQSMIWAMDAVSLNDIILPSLRCFADMVDTVNNAELVMSGKVMDAGYDVVAMEGRFNSHTRPKAGSASGEGGSKKGSETFLEWCRGPESQATGGSDVHRTGMYEGASLHPWDTIFVKTNRVWEQQDQKTIDLLTKFADDERYSSYDRCG